MPVSNHTGSHWRDSSRVPKFFIIDGRCALFFVLFLFHPRWWTFILSVSVVVLLGVMDYFKLTLVVTVRLIRGCIAGKRKISGD